MELSFVEILFVFFIALLVLGPQELVLKAQSIGRWVGKAKREWNNLRVMAKEEFELIEKKSSLPATQTTPIPVKSPNSALGTANSVSDTTPKPFHIHSPAVSSLGAEDTLNHG